MHFQLLNNPAVLTFVQFLRDQQKAQSVSYQSLRLPLNDKQQALAKQLNSLYSKMVWGIRNSATNNHLREDETRIIHIWAANEFWNEHILEVGCGAGRMTAALAYFARKLTAIDIEREVVERAAKKMKAKPHVALHHCDLLSLKGANQFSSVLMMENLIGMVPQPADRHRHYKIACNLLREGGLLVIAFRVVDTEAGAVNSYHVLPYDALVPGIGRRRIFAIAVNWSVVDFIAEINNSGLNLKLLKLVPGESRPAGGQMYSALFVKSSIHLDTFC